MTDDANTAGKTSLDEPSLPVLAATGHTMFDIEHFNRAAFAQSEGVLVLATSSVSRTSLLTEIKEEL